MGLLREKLSESIDLQCDRGYAFAIIDYSPRSSAIYWGSKRPRESAINSPRIHFLFRLITIDSIFFRKYYESTIFLAPIQKSKQN